MKKLLPYRIFRSRRAGPVIVVQQHCPESGASVTPRDLRPYRARQKLRTPWAGVEKLAAGSTLLLTEKSARYLLQAGTIEPIDEMPLIISRGN